MGFKRVSNFLWTQQILRHNRSYRVFMSLFVLIMKFNAKTALTGSQNCFETTQYLFGNIYFYYLQQVTGI